ncbi:hypothetical protein PoB_006366800 [Plakobranchus ocellatus]|uniref:Uncharacterized protein n=1 Tax=Plakobranchus ocellatus TaxID=259542 RepID=A0AAV4CZD0_9GAST|nr:hypothetical protein PoB_006366800 [Plakobranchus ocellatus]
MDRKNLNIQKFAEVLIIGIPSPPLSGDLSFPREDLVGLERGWEEGYTSGGLDFLFDETKAKSMRSWCPKSDRVGVAKPIAKPLHLRTIQGFAPISDGAEKEEEKFHDEMLKAKGYPKS